MSLMDPEHRVHLCPVQVSFAPVTLNAGASGRAVRCIFSVTGGRGATDTT